MAEKISIDDLHDLVLKQQETITALQGKVIQQETLIDAKKAAPVPTVPKVNVKVDSKEYKWNVATFHLPGDAEKMTAEEAATDKKVIARILKIEGQNILTLQV